MTRLPDLPSQLIRLALKDLDATLKDPRYIVDMEIWHVPSHNDICHVCLAGAVMAKSLNQPPDYATNPSIFDLDTGQKLHALDFFRTGSVLTALELLDIIKPDGLESYATVPAYFDDDPQPFIDAMNGLANLLEEHGL